MSELLGTMVALAPLLIVGCAAPLNHIVVLQNPLTLQTVECRAEPWGALNAAGQISECTAAYKRAGYKVAGE